MCGVKVITILQIYIYLNNIILYNSSDFNSLVNCNIYRDMPVKSNEKRLRVKL